MSANPAPRSPALQSFDRIWEDRSKGFTRSLEPMQAYRRQAMSRFLRLGLPTLRDESWHYTNLRILAQRSFAQSPGMPVAPGAANCRSWLPGDDQWPVIRLINALPQATDFGCAPAGVTVSALRDLERADSQRLAALMPPLSDLEPQRWALLNAALFEDGLHIKISGQCSVPLLILHVGTPAVIAGENLVQEFVNPRILIEAEAGSSAVILEHHVNGGAGALFSNSVCSVQLGDNAKLEHFRLFSGNAATTHADHLQVRIGANARMRQHTIGLDGGFIRVNLEATLAAAGASLDNYCLLTGHDARHLDCMNLVTHASPHTTSRQTARIIASGRSRAIFNSKVIVTPGAQKADSYQSSRGLLLSPTAEIDTRPQLEIHANDVKCAHGATTGRLDPDMLFYLLARGLDRGTAQSLLVFAFLADALREMSLPAVRASIESKLIEQLPDATTLRQFR